MYQAFIKPFFDVLFSILLLIVISPIFVMLVLLLMVANNGKPFFTQQRVGKKLQIFRVIKFKTMNDKKDASGNLLSDAERLTAVGKFVRKTSLDELPQLLNVAKGDMSFVGPRPLLVEYIARYSSEQNKRHLVQQGITGWAQVNGRNAISWQRKFELDVWYVNNQSFWVDIKILFLTVFKVLKPEGISANGSATMEKFMGDNALND